MTVSSPPQDPSAPLPVQADDASSMRTAAQWLAAAAGAVGATLIASLQIGDIGALVDEPRRLASAAGAFLVALGVIGLTIRRAGAVLVVSRSTIGDLLAAETREGYKDQASISFPGRNDRDLQAVINQIGRNREWLMPGHTSAWSLYHAWDEARKVAALTGPADVGESHAQVADQLRQLNNVCAFARCELTRLAYQRLSATITGLPGALFTLALIVLAVVLGWPAHQPPAVVAPYRLDVLLTGPPAVLRAAGLDAGCRAGTRLTGVALDGSLTEPVVVTETARVTLGGETVTCPTSRFTVSEDVGIPIPYVAAQK
jgi:hypothetical protein